MNNYDLQMGLAYAGPLTFIIGAALCVLVGWLLTKK